MNQRPRLAALADDKRRNRVLVLTPQHIHHQFSQHHRRVIGKFVIDLLPNDPKYD